MTTTQAPHKAATAVQQQITSLHGRWPEAIVDAAAAERFLKELSDQIDQFLRILWPTDFVNQPLALVAVGGYGRQEQFPHSDIDILILIDDHRWDEAIQTFLYALWDEGLPIGHAVRTLDECVEAGREDVTVYTNLLDARLIIGDAPLFQALIEVVRSDRITQDWPFFLAKLAEQNQRYEAQDAMGARIEPNIKESPGGLRDLQTIRWISNRVAGAGTLAGMHRAELLRDQEWHSLEAAQGLLYRVRIGLHALAGRGEERLLLMHQKALAAHFQFTEDSDGNLAVERFMQSYFRATIEIERLNRLILQNFREQLDPHPATEITPLNPRFQIRGNLLETTDAQVFMRAPTATLELFLLLAQHPELIDMSASTARQLRANLSVIDAGFRKNPHANQLFLEILRGERGVYRALKAMNLSGVLAAYIPAFGQIVGLMQFDLFHAYTVDTHTLLVTRNLRRFSRPEFANELPMASAIFSRIEKPEVLYLAGLFHDIAKGRGGDHAILGAVDARIFAQQHGLPEEAVDRLAWLVENHLLMSFTAQRRDIEDPAIIREFGQKVGSRERLDELFLLTVADIRGTNPNLWNAWRDALLKRLHQLTSAWFEEGEQSAHETIRTNRTDAQDQGEAAGLSRAGLQAWLAALPDDYFLRTDTLPILQHARLALEQTPLPTLEISSDPEQHATQILILTNDHPALFAHIVAEIDRQGLNVQSANMTLIPATQPDQPDRALFEFFALNGQGAPALDAWSIEHLTERLTERLAHPEGAPPVIRRRMKPQLASIDVATQIEFLPDRARQRTLVQISTKDRPGLLADLTEAFAREGVFLRHARISTLGERVEDAFYVVDARDRPIEVQETRTRLEATLRDAINSSDR
ncbi:protein-P-II uridylyltransferase [Halothiobacillus diazotrophicus]|uniref:Bifunctional uridylyltransferase/uridylyl-removing enzyme n=1 Tax=Halothiobacillus diazotrophicus TaxID=1860122 RepID=A0A191ZHA2_9GAMM|nr:[protein-PII] uridylyltransferase [Halothiobacillus diazotrophicus]ANJ67245.1 protein-P-II uridylyltransferase [Halothiobacillus diazotrophicus]